MVWGGTLAGADRELNKPKARRISRTPRPLIMPLNGRMKNDGDESGKMAKEIVLFPEGGPRQIQEQRSHLKEQNNGKRTQ